MTDYSNYWFYKQLERYHEGDIEAINADVKLVEINFQQDGEEFTDEPLISLFVFKDTPQGHAYWWERHHRGGL